jgi:hypothetical protein
VAAQAEINRRFIERLGTDAARRGGAQITPGPGQGQAEPQLAGLIRCHVLKAWWDWLKNSDRQTANSRHPATYSWTPLDCPTVQLRRQRRTMSKTEARIMGHPGPVLHRMSEKQVGPLFLQRNDQRHYARSAPRPGPIGIQV